MTYESGDYFEDGITHTRVGYFSNPALQYEGVPTGDDFDADFRNAVRDVRTFYFKLVMENQDRYIPNFGVPAEKQNCPVLQL